MKSTLSLSVHKEYYLQIKNVHNVQSRTMYLMGSCTLMGGIFSNKALKT